MSSRCSSFVLLTLSGAQSLQEEDEDEDSEEDSELARNTLLNAAGAVEQTAHGGGGTALDEMD